jgi:NAD(P)-dependent dehydrogenase (short-subunit alcohol dehydrogenase family)
MNMNNVPSPPSPARTAVVTGASRGLGRALAGWLGAAGYALVIDARDGAALESARGALHGSGTRAPIVAIPGDVTDPAHRAALQHAADVLGGADLLVNNAGTLGASPLPAMADYPLAELRTAFEVNVVAPVALTRALLPSLRRRGSQHHLRRRRRRVRGLGRVRRGQGRPGAGVERPGGRGEQRPGLVGRPRGSAHPHARPRVPG